MGYDYAMVIDPKYVCPFDAYFVAAAEHVVQPTFPVVCYVDAVVCVSH